MGLFFNQRVGAGEPMVVSLANAVGTARVVRHGVAITISLAMLVGATANAGEASMRVAQKSDAATQSSVVIKAAIDEARTTLDNILIDYPGTRFRQVRLIQETDFLLFCGEFNMTNRMGGYTGWTRFALPIGESPFAKIMDKPTIEGRPTAIDRLMNTYGTGEKRDSSTRMIDAKCGETAKRVDAIDYTSALTFK